MTSSFMTWTEWEVQRKGKGILLCWFSSHMLVEIAQSKPALYWYVWTGSALPEAISWVSFWKVKEPGLRLWTSSSTFPRI